MSDSKLISFNLSYVPLSVIVHKLRMTWSHQLAKPWWLTSQDQLHFEPQRKNVSKFCSVIVQIGQIVNIFEREVYGVILVQCLFDRTTTTTRVWIRLESYSFQWNAQVNLHIRWNLSRPTWPYASDRESCGKGESSGCHRTEIQKGEQEAKNEKAAKWWKWFDCTRSLLANLDSLHDITLPL